MVDKPEGTRKRVAAKPIEIIDLSMSEDVPPTTLRGMAASVKRKHHNASPGPRTAHSAKIILDAAVPPLDLASTRSGSQSPHSRSQQQSSREESFPRNPTLAQRVAHRVSDSGEPSSSHQTPRNPCSSSGRAASPPASQVHISREGPSSATYATFRPTKGSQGTSGRVFRRKRSRERDGEALQQPTAKKIKSSQGNDQLSNRPQVHVAKTFIKKQTPFGTGKDGNPIVISDSPPPETHSSRTLLPGIQRTPKQPKAPASNGPGKTSRATPPRAKSESTTSHGGTRREVPEYNVFQGDNSPIIPESLPGSPEVNMATVAIGSQSTALPLVVPPSDKVSSSCLDHDVGTISSFAEQAEELLASQSDYTIPFVAATQERNPDGLGRALSSFVNVNGPTNEGGAMALSSPGKGTDFSVSREPTGKGGLAIGDHNTAIVKPGNLMNSHKRNQMPRNATPTTADDIERVINKYVQELRDDNTYWTRTWLKRARHMAVEPYKSRHTLTSVFRDMKSILPVSTPTERASSDLSARFTIEAFNGGGKSSKRSYSIPCTMYQTRTDADVPDYSHFVNIKHSFLARNETVLQHWPYFGDDFDIQEAAELQEHYYMDVSERERKIKRLAQAENYAEYVEDMLRDVGCTWSDVLRFLLDPEPNVGTNPEALAALRKRDEFCDEDFIRGGQRWTTVLSKLSTSNDPDRVGRAALLCECFQKIAKFQLWHVARRSDYTTKMLAEEERKLDLNEITCRICMRYNCPYHGEMHENPSGGSDSERDGSAAEDIVETDIIHPYRVNYRSRVKFPTSVDTDETGAEIDPKSKKVEYWHKRNLNHYPDDRRGPFYPCYHPGTTCEKTQCSCFVDRIPCEKSCACPPTCKRKWQGCECRKKGGPNMICFEDQRCACFQYGRECDADLCGDCGVSDVLDPVHRHDDNILRGRCHNASIQRGVPRHTILGDSGIHGLGLYACEDVQTHDFVGEYKGEVITKDEAERRGAVYEHQKLSYLFTLNKKQEVDSTLFGNKIRFINHATDKQANLYPRIIMVNTIFRIGLYGKRKIKAGQEFLFDYGDQFPQDQLGGKANKERKAAPHLRNKNLVKEFDEVVETMDKFGNRRARKAAGGNKRGKPPPKGFGAAATGAEECESSFVARKSTGFSSNRDAARSRAVRSKRNEHADRGIVDTALQQRSLDGRDLDAGHRLLSYNLAPDDEDEDGAYFQRDLDEDDNFAPRGDRSSDDRNFDDTSSIDGGDEDEDDSDDDNELQAAVRTRTRSSRPRNVVSRMRM